MTKLSLSPEMVFVVLAVVIAAIAVALGMQKSSGMPRLALRSGRRRVVMIPRDVAPYHLKRIHRTSLPLRSSHERERVEAFHSLTLVATARTRRGQHRRIVLVKLWFRFRAYNVEVLTTPGPVLLVPNHVSWLDWLFLGAVLDDDWKFVTSSTSAELSWLHRKIMTGRRTFPVDTTSPYAVRAMADHLAGGGKLVLFAEGRISITGALMKVYDGTGFLIHKTGAKVITCYLRGASRVRWVRHPGWKQWCPRVSRISARCSPRRRWRASLTPSPGRNWRRGCATGWCSSSSRSRWSRGPRNVLAAVAETAGQYPAVARRSKIFPSSRSAIAG
jgi:1-acyl-sn-glycerol-3-phosphate acyltransferase